MIAFRNPVPMNEVLFDKDMGSMLIDTLRPWLIVFSQVAGNMKA